MRRIVPSAAGRGSPASTLPGSATYSVSHRSRDGWSGGMLRSSKLYSVGLDLGPLEDLEAVGVEDLAQVAHRAVMHRVEVTDRASAGPARSCRAPRRPVARRAAVPASSPSRALDGGLELRAHLVGELPERRALLGRDALPRPRQQERSALPDRPSSVVAEPLDRSGVGGGGRARSARSRTPSASARLASEDRSSEVAHRSRASIIGENERPRPGFREQGREDRRGSAPVSW